MHLIDGCSLLVRVTFVISSLPLLRPWTERGAMPFGCKDACCGTQIRPESGQISVSRRRLVQARVCMRFPAPVTCPKPKFFSRSFMWKVKVYLCSQWGLDSTSLTSVWSSKSAFNGSAEKYLNVLPIFFPVFTRAPHPHSQNSRHSPPPLFFFHNNFVVTDSCDPWKGSRALLSYFSTGRWWQP